MVYVPETGNVVARRGTPNKEPKSTIKVDEFDGTTSIENFLLNFEYTTRYNQWQDNDEAAHLAAALTGSAGLVLWNLTELTYDELVKRLRLRYGSAEQMEKSRHELRTRRLRRGEGLQELAQDVERLAALAYPDHPQVTRKLLGVQDFIEALGDEELIFKVREREPPTLQGALNIVMKLEILCQARDAKTSKSSRPVY